MILYLLDTNAVSDLVRNPQGQVAQQYSLRAEDAATSIIVAAELRYGAERRGSLKLRVQLDAVLAHLPALPFDTPADFAYAQIRSALERTGSTISANDLLIAAHALALDCILVTDNEREFSLVPGLRVENWLRPG
ncbi:MAG: PIN domain-containing protein [Brevundimonas sp.]|uniref:PIN domain-containing protein n=1 Tax=Brevundimonas sp. TaxID=1871086 RepID=UPI002718399D|nr:PIN domain-containing protein [Brevundimonas sp.]MDO9609423.1 PIN domain-containing protein [Brevundimonas sp.]